MLEVGSGHFNPHDHYWIVNGDESRLWSSARGAFVLPDDATCLVWQAAGNRPTRIANAFELDQVLRQHEMSLGRAFTADEALAALAVIDAGRLKATLGRDDLRAGSLVAGDADKLRALTGALQPARREGSKPAPPEIEGATQPVTIEERIAKLEGGLSAMPAVSK
jgi:hypothetical protein